MDLTAITDTQVEEIRTWGVNVWHRWLPGDMSWPRAGGFASSFRSINRLQVFLEEATEWMDRISFASTTNGFLVLVESICFVMGQRRRASSPLCTGPG